jgi:tRNA(Ile)-lysidine synthase
MKTDNILLDFEKIGLETGLLSHNNRILVGISGGCDSVALLLLLLEFKAKYSLEIMCAHINYNLRGEDSFNDEKFVEDLCRKYNLHLFIKRTVLDKKESIQNQARIIRFNFFNKLVKAYKINSIALAHHKDDQVETVIQRIIRGSGFKGLAGILNSNNNIIHPLLIFSKKQLQTFLAKKNIQARIDTSNFQNDYNRNKIRNELIPLLEKEYNPNISERIIEYSNLFHISEEYFNNQVKKVFKKCLILQTENSLALDSDAILKLSPIMIFYILRNCWLIISGSEDDFYSIHFKEIMSIIKYNRGYTEISLPKKIKVYKDYSQIIFIKDDLSLKVNKENSKEIDSIRSVFTFNESRYYMKKMKNLPESGYICDNDQAYLDLDKIIFPIKLRYRNTGDKFIPLGMNNFKKVKDFFINKKISKLQRDNIVLFEDMEKIFWICGCRIDQRVAISNDTKNILMIKQENCSEIRRIKVKI